MRKPLVRALQGVALSAGSPLGWLIVRVLHGVDPWLELLSNAGVYVYMLLGTALAFAGFGGYVGVQEALRLEESLHDALTGLYNTRYFWRHLREELAFAARHQRPLALLIGDIDRFKRVNDTWGHAEGDRVLAAVAAALMERRRRGDTLARVGGEEFAVILPETDLAEAQQVAERLREGVAALRLGPQARTPAVTMSFGAVASAPERPLAAGTLYELADAAMYEAKEQGRDRVVAREAPRMAVPVPVAAAAP